MKDGAVVRVGLPNPPGGGKGRRSWQYKRIGGLVIVGVSLGPLLTGCPVPREAAGLTSGCEQEYGVRAADRPETSRLSCTAIDRLTDSMPSEPEAFLERGDSPRLLWKCRFYGTETQQVLLRCEHGDRHFSIVKSGTK